MWKKIKYFLKIRKNENYNFKPIEWTIIDEQNRNDMITEIKTFKKLGESFNYLGVDFVFKDYDYPASKYDLISYLYGIHCDFYNKITGQVETRWFSLNDIKILKEYFKSELKNKNIGDF